MGEDTLVSRRLIKGYMTNKDIKPRSISITSPMITHVRASNMRYHLHLEEEKKKKQDSEKNLEKLHLTNQINNNNINEDCDNLKMTIERLSEQFIQLAKKAEEKNQMQYLVDGNAMKRNAEEKTE